MVDDEARWGVEVTVGEEARRLEDPASKGDARVAEEATVVDDAAMVEVEAMVVEVDMVDVETKVVEVEKELMMVDAAMAGLLLLFGRRDSLSLSIFNTSTRRCF